MGAGDFDALYRQLRSPLLWHLRCMGASQAEAADAVQEAFAQALLAAGRVRDDRAWPAWLRTVAARSYLRSVAKRGGISGRSRAVSVVTVAGVPDVAVTAGPSTAVREHLDQEQVFSLVAGLPPRQRYVFALHYEGWSTAEIAAELSMERAAVRQSLARARAALKEKLPQGSASLGSKQGDA